MCGAGSVDYVKALMPALKGARLACCATSWASRPPRTPSSTRPRPPSGGRRRSRRRRAPALRAGMMGASHHDWDTKSPASDRDLPQSLPDDNVPRTLATSCAWRRQCSTDLTGLGPDPRTARRPIVAEPHLMAWMAAVSQCVEGRPHDRPDTLEWMMTRHRLDALIDRRFVRFRLIAEEIRPSRAASGSSPLAGSP